MKIVGSVVTGSGSVNASGGSAGTGGAGAAAGVSGRFVLGANNSSASVGSVTGAMSISDAAEAPMDANPFLSGTPSTPDLDNLTDGTNSIAEAYGLTTLSSGNSIFSSVVGGANGADMALYRASSYNDGSNTITFTNNGVSYDVVYVVNLSGSSLSTPEMGGGPAASTSNWRPAVGP